MSNCNKRLINNEWLINDFVDDMIEIGAYEKHIKIKIQDFINEYVGGEKKNWYELKNYFYNPNVDDITLLMYIAGSDYELYESTIQFMAEKDVEDVNNIREKICKTAISLRLNDLYDEIKELLKKKEQLEAIKIS